MRHCDHCYELGYKAGLAAAEKAEKPSDEDDGGAQMVRISLTDEIRSAYGIPAEMTEAIAMVEGPRIITILDTYRSTE